MASDTRRLKVVVDGDATGGNRALNSLDKNVQQSSSHISKAGLIFGGFAAKAALGLGVVAVAAGGFGLKTAAGIEQAQVAFTNMLGSASKAQTFLKQLQNFANSTPFEFPDLVQSSQQLLAMGFNAKDLIPTLTAVGDAVAAMGGGSENVAAVTRALGQMQAKGKVAGDELLQLTEQGIPAVKILASQFGVSTAKMQDMISKGLVPASKAIPALVQGLEHGTKSTQSFGGMMAKQSETMAGKWSTFMDTLQTGLGTLVLKAKPALLFFLTLATNAFTNFFQGLGGKGVGFFAAMGKSLRTFALGVRALVLAFKDGDVTSDGFVGAMEKLGQAVRALVLAFKEGDVTSDGFVGVMERIGVAVRAVVGFVQTKLVPAIVAFGGILKTDILPVVGRFAANIIPALVTAFKAVADFISTKVWPLLVKLGEFLGKTFKPTWDALVRVWQEAILPALQKLFKAFQDNKTQLGDFFKAIGIVIGVIILLATKILGFLLPILVKLAGNAIVLVVNSLKVLIQIIGVVVRVVKGLWEAFQFLQRVSKAAWEGLKEQVRGAVAYVVGIFLGMIGAIVNGAARGFGWIPGLGGKLKSAAAAFNTFKDQVNASLANVKSRKVTVTAESIFTGGGGTHGVRAAAKGGIFSRFASGSENHIAQVAKGGDWRVWAEDETGGEAYIPLAAGKRARSTAILGAVAKKFGYGLVPAASGLIVSAQTQGLAAFNKGVNNFNASVNKSVIQQAQKAFNTVGVGGGVQRWAGMVLQILSLLHQPSTLLGAVLRRMQFESGGNPFAINLTDSNAKAGHPSKGLMQTIQGTFNAYANGFRGRGIYDPFANIYAGLAYALARYGSITAIDPLVRPRGYDNGGILPPGMTMAYNGTGHNEFVSTGKPERELHIHFHGIVAGDRKAIAADLHSLLRERKRDLQQDLGL